jgi:hypothetical protein
MGKTYPQKPPRRGEAAGRRCARQPARGLPWRRRRGPGRTPARPPSARRLRGRASAIPSGKRRPPPTTRPGRHPAHTDWVCRWQPPCEAVDRGGLAGTRQTVAALSAVKRSRHGPDGTTIRACGARTVAATARKIGGCSSPTAPDKSTAMGEQWSSRAPQRAFERLERLLGTRIRAVLRGRGCSNGALLPD